MFSRLLDSFFGFKIFCVIKAWNGIAGSLLSICSDVLCRGHLEYILYIVSFTTAYEENDQ